MGTTADLAMVTEPRASVDALTIARTRRTLAERFRAVGIDSADLDARILVGHALGLDHAALAAANDRTLAAGGQDAIDALARRRLSREPVARIVGCKEFWSLKLSVNAATLVPRPETETVVETALAAVDAEGSRERPLRIADLGTGCGALLLALLGELPNAFGIGTDTSLGALRVARDNAERLRFTRATFVACNLAAALCGPYDLIVANPPYVASGEIDALAPEIRDFEPRSALDGGLDGLQCYRTIAEHTPVLLAADGALVVEIGIGQAQAVAALFSAAGLAPTASRPDLNHVPRALLARKLARNGHGRAALGPGKKALGISAGTD